MLPAYRELLLRACPGTEIQGIIKVGVLHINDIMSSDTGKTYVHCLKAMLRPVVRFCVKRSLGIQSVIECVKAVFIEVAAEEMSSSDERVNVSRLSVMTGLHRRDVMRIYKEGDTLDTVSSFAGRVIGQWEQDAQFLTRNRKPRVLTIDGERSEFRDLVRKVSSDVNAGTVLFELERIGAVERIAKGIRLKQHAHTVRHDPEESFSLLGRDIDDLVQAVSENVFENAELRNLHARTEYDNVREEALPEIRRWFLKEGAAFHLKARNYLSAFDLDINPEPNKKGGGKIVIGTFGRTSEKTGE